MSVRINTNIEALNAQRNLSTTAATFAKSVEQLSSGIRINRAADDAAGLAISEKMRAQVTGMQQGLRNAQDGVSMIQTAEGALIEDHAILQRMRELAVEAANSTLSSTDAASVGTEISALKDEIDRISGSTTFNGQYLLTGELSVNQLAGSLAVGGSVGAAVVNKIDMSGANGSSTYTLTSLAGSKITLDDGAGHAQTLQLVANAQTLSFDALGVTIGITGTDTAANIAAALTTKNITTTATTQANFQIGANASDYLLVSFQDARTSNTDAANGYSTLAADISTFVTATTSGSGIVAAAQALITATDTGIGYVSKVRGNLGAVQNRLEHTTASISVASENLNASMSRIKDLDVASEMVNFTKTQILQQAGTAILAQANSAPQNILTLLR